MATALCHLGTHVGAVLSLGAGAVSFTHIVKVRRHKRAEDLSRIVAVSAITPQLENHDISQPPHRLQASEPVVSALLSAVFLKQFLPIPVYISLLPVIGGVGLASLKELR